MSEWVSEWIAMGYFARSPLNDPQGPAFSRITPNGGARTIKGGSFADPLNRLRSAYRGYRPADIKYGALGFRVVCVVK